MFWLQKDRVVFGEERLTVIFPYHRTVTLESRPVACTWVYNDLSNTPESAACVDKENRIEAYTMQGCV